MSQSFEEVESELSSDEKILWKQTKLSKKWNAIKIKIFLYVFFIGGSILSFLLYFSITFNDPRFFYIHGIILAILFIIFCPNFFLFHDFKSCRKIAKVLNVKIGDLKNYEEFIILTNKRWIQKSLKLIEYDYADYSNDLIRFEKDFIFVNLRDIHVIHIFPTLGKNKTKSLDVHPYILWDFIDEDGETEEPLPQITVEKADYLILMENLHKLFTITKEEHGICADDDRVLFVKKKN